MCRRSSVAVSGGYSLVVVCGLLIAVGSLAAEHCLWSIASGALPLEHWLWSTGSVLVHGLSCSLACTIFLDQVWNLCLLPWQADSLPLSHQGKTHLTHRSLQLTVDFVLFLKKYVNRIVVLVLRS